MGDDSGAGGDSKAAAQSKPLLTTTTVTLTSTKDHITRVLGKRTRTKWERRWVLVPNVLDLNLGEIWVQKWVTVESAEKSK